MENTFLQYDFNDFDLFVETVRDWQLDFCQLDRGASQCNLYQIINQRMIVGYFRASRSIKQQGAPPEQMWTFSLLTPRSPVWVWGGHEVTSGTMVVYRPGADFDCVSPPGFEVFTVSALPELIGQLCEQLEMPDLLKQMSVRSIVRCPPANFIELINRTHQFTQIVKTLPDDRAGYKLRCKHEKELLRMLLTTLADGLFVQHNRKSMMLNSVTKKVDEYLGSNPFEALTVKKLCEIANVNERTLQHNFRDAFGFSPKNYLKAMYLNRVRKELLNSAVETPLVSDVANRWGFWHMGQFAADYRKLFGELPSQTLGGPRKLRPAILGPRQGR